MRGRPRARVGDLLTAQGTYRPSGFQGVGPVPALGRRPRRGFREPVRLAKAAFSTEGSLETSQTLTDLQPGDLVLASWAANFTLTFTGSSSLTGTDRVKYKWITTDTSLTITNGSGTTITTLLTVVIRGADPTQTLTGTAMASGVTPSDPRAAVLFIARTGSFSDTQPPATTAAGFVLLASGIGYRSPNYAGLCAYWSPLQGMASTGAVSLSSNGGSGTGHLIPITMLK